MNRETIGEHFRVQQMLGSGGFGTVYRARDTALDRDVAVKVLSAINSTDPVARARFEREAKLLSQLRHPHIVSIFNLGIDSDGLIFIAMQLLEGQTLRSTIRTEGPLAPLRAAKIIAQVAAAVDYAHSKDVIHRDLKPDNIMLLNSPEPDFVAVLDFGLSAFSFGDQFNIQRLTQTGEIVGTATYMSPEMCLGGRANACTDVYALGCVLYECLAGHAPFLADDPVQLLAKHIGSDPPALPDSVPSDLAKIALKAMQKDPKNRFQSMADLLGALNAVLAGQPVPISNKELKVAGAAHAQKAPKWLIPAIIGACASILIVGYLARPKENFEQEDAAWRAQLDAADKDLFRRFPEDCAMEYQRARSLARTDRQKYLSDVSLAKVSSIRAPIDDPLAKELEASLKEAVSLTVDPREKNFARLLWGTCCMFAYDYAPVLEALKGKPWTDAKPPSEDALFANKLDRIQDWAKLGYGTALGRGKPEQPEEALRFLRQEHPHPGEVGPGFAWYCEISRDVLHSKVASAAEKDLAKQTLRRVYLQLGEPLVDYRYQIRIIRDELGDTEVERLYAQRQARAKT